MISFMEGVEVWIADATVNTAALKDLEHTLSPAERNQALRFHVDKHRLRYVFAHSILRDVLAKYTATTPRQIEFETNDFGKPFLRCGERPARLQFNLAHSENLVVIAVMRDHAIGVDTEFVRTVSDIDAIVRGSFTESEQAMVHDSAPNQKEHSFFVCWTRKEAYIKAVGKGMSISLNSFDTTSMKLQSNGRGPWRLADLQMPKGYVGAIAVEGVQPKITYKKLE